MSKRSIVVSGAAMLLLIVVMLAVSITSAAPENQQGAGRTRTRTRASGQAGAALTAVAGTAQAAATRIAGTAGAAVTQLAGTLQAAGTQAMGRIGTAAPTMTAIRATLDALPATIPTQVIAFFEALEGQTSMEYDPETGMITIGSTVTEAQLNYAVDASTAVLGYDPNSLNVDLSAPNLLVITLIDPQTGNVYTATYAMGISGVQFTAVLVGLTFNGRTVAEDQIPPVVITASGAVLASLNGVFEALGITYSAQSITIDDVNLTTVVAFTLSRP